MNQFKEVVFLRIKIESSKGDKKEERISYKNNLESIRSTIKKSLKWTNHSKNYQMNQYYLNIEGKTLYRQGVIVTQHSQNRFTVQILKTVPQKDCLAYVNQSFEKINNFINFKYDQSKASTNPVSLFLSMGYKIQNNFKYKEVECFTSLTYGIQVIIYPQSGYIQFIESYPNNIEPHFLSSITSYIVKQIQSKLQWLDNIKIEQDNLKPVDIKKQLN